MRIGQKSTSRDVLTAKCSLSMESEVCVSVCLSVCLSLINCHAIVGGGYLSTEKEEEEAQERAKECELS